MRIQIDTREPWPHPWTPFLPADVHVVRATLETGDVALAAFPEGAVIERKRYPTFSLLWAGSGSGSNWS